MCDWMLLIEEVGPEVSEKFRQKCQELGVTRIDVPKRMPKEAVLMLERSRISHGCYEELKRKYGLSKRTIYRYAKKLKEDKA